MSIRVLFAGTPACAVPCLEKLNSTERVVITGVLTSPDSRQGRGRKLRPCAVKSHAQSNGLKVLQYEKLNEQALAEIEELMPDVIVVVAYGFILPPQLLKIPVDGCINVHFSLLPRWRGAAPVARAIEAGDAITGITLMMIDEGLDTGPVLARHAVKIEQADTTESLEQRLAQLGAKHITDALPKFSSESLVPERQNENEANYAKKVKTWESEINWESLAAVDIDRKIRAFNPKPVMRTWLGSNRIRFWSSVFVEADTAGIEPGTVIHSNNKGLVIAARDGAVKILSIQKESKNRMEISKFLAGSPIPEGSKFTSGPSTGADG